MRTKQIIMRVSAEELCSIDRLASARSMRRATFLRAAALDSIPPVVPPINQHALAELHRIGSNINQIAHSVNCGNSPGLDELRAQCAALRLALLEARKK